MKRIFSIFLVLTMLIAPVAAHADEAKLSVVTTIFPPYDFVREVAGDRVQLAMLLPPGSESHSYEPTPKDIITIQNCDVFIYGGGEGDAWVDDVLESMDTGNMKIIAMMDCVEAVEEEIVPGMEHEHEDEHEDEHEHDHDHDAELDEHVWTSPKNAVAITTVIANTLAGLDPANADAYAQNAGAYTAKLDELDAGFRAVVEGAARKTLVFGDRFPFRYFADAYGLDYFAAFPGCSTETEASAATVAFLIDKISDEGIPVVFHIELSNGRMAQSIAEETGAKVLQMHSSHNVSKDDFEGGASYMTLMTQNIEALKEALN